MNPTALPIIIKTASSLWERAKDYREEKSREAYSVLELSLIHI